MRNGCSVFESSESVAVTDRRPKTMPLARIRELVGPDMQRVDARIRRQLHSNVVLINQLSGHIINNGGKRLRPLLVLLSAGASGYKGVAHLEMAAVIEFIHTATLLHDDVVDESDLRRGAQTANALWGNAASVLVGDYLYSRSFQMMVAVGNVRVMEIMADTTNVIAEGEVMQLLNVHDPDTTEARYMEVIHHKTAKLFEAAARMGAVLAGQTPEQEEALARYGIHLGTAFQLIDDVLDYSADVAETGKNIGDDLAEGKPTLPLIYAMRAGNQEQAQLVREAIVEGGLDRVDAVRGAIEATGAIQYTSRLAGDEARRAIEAVSILADTEFKRALVGLAEFSAHRSY
jgi:octaprenyl-diphosphate synthase